MYMGVCKVGEKSRRIDIKVYPKEQFAFAVLYFTGSAHFNRSMRGMAEQKGYSLSDHGIVPVVGKTKAGRSVPCETEEDVFKFLGMPYKQPAERDL